jgi:hypothetical protein
MYGSGDEVVVHWPGHRMHGETVIRLRYLTTPDVEVFFRRSGRGIGKRMVLPGWTLLPQRADGPKGDWVA